MATTDTTVPQPVPFTEDHDSGPFWAGAARGDLLVAIGQDGRPVHPARHQGVNTPITWVPAAGTGRVHSWIVSEHAVDPAFPVPYTVVLVELTDHPEVRLVGHIPGRADLQAGDPMQVVFESRDGVTIPNWRPSTALPDVDGRKNESPHRDPR